jgi:hypothetical protein
MGEKNGLRRLTVLSFCLYTQECKPVVLGRSELGTGSLNRGLTGKGKREPHRDQ